MTLILVLLFFMSKETVTITINNNMLHLFLKTSTFGDNTPYICCMKDVSSSQNMVTWTEFHMLFTCSNIRLFDYSCVFKYIFVQTSSFSISACITRKLFCCGLAQDLENGYCQEYFFCCGLAQDLEIGYCQELKTDYTPSTYTMQKRELKCT